MTRKLLVAIAFAVLAPAAALACPNKNTQAEASSPDSSEMVAKKAKKSKKAAAPKSTGQKG